jgi:hypothetical protein
MLVHSENPRINGLDQSAHAEAKIRTSLYSLKPILDPFKDNQVYCTLSKVSNTVISHCLKKIKRYFIRNRKTKQKLLTRLEAWCPRQNRFNGKIDRGKKWFSGQRKMVSYRVIVCFNRVKFMSWWITFLCSLLSVRFSISVTNEDNN